MDRLSSVQLHVLQLLDSGEIALGDLSDSENSACKYLVKSGLAKFRSESEVISAPGVAGIRSKAVAATITEAGRAYLASFEVDESRFQSGYRLDKISIIISCVALLVSLVALFR